MLGVFLNQVSFLLWETGFLAKPGLLCQQALAMRSQVYQVLVWFGFYFVLTWVLGITLWSSLFAWRALSPLSHLLSPLLEMFEKV